MPVKIVSVVFEPGRAVTMLFSNGTYLIFWLVTPTIALDPKFSHIFPPEDAANIEAFIADMGRYGQELMQHASLMVQSPEPVAA